VDGHLGDGGGWGLKGKVEPCRVEPIAPADIHVLHYNTPFQVSLSTPVRSGSDPGLGVLLVVVFFLLSSHIPMFESIDLRIVFGHMVSVPRRAPLYGWNQRHTYLACTGLM